MKEERTEGKKSKNRDLSVEQNLEIWYKMLAEKFEDNEKDNDIRKYCVRGKIDFINVNKCLRDPVFYRFNNLPHLRTGTKYCLYPTYDWAVPLVDSIEGVTHCMRSTEFNDRSDMYKWILSKTGLDDIIIYEYSKLNFEYTVLSKRNLRWVVQNNLVDGWNDPRFPTIQGVLRRGIQVQTLKEFMIAQGPSRANVLMEWDKFYANNAKIIDPNAKRLFAVRTEKKIPVLIENMDEIIIEETVPWHSKNLDLGSRKQYRYNKLFIEEDDTLDIIEGQKLTLYKWGNTVITKIDRLNEKVVGLTLKLNLEDLNFKKTKIVHWVPNNEEFVI